MPVQQHCVIDIEASGFGRHSYPIEVGFVRSDGHAWCSLVLPQADWQHWDSAAEQVHCIPRKLLLQHGRPALEVAQRLNADLAGCTAYCDGWAHDYTWLAKLFDAADLSPRFHLEAVQALLSETHLAQLDLLQRQAFAVLGITRHRASGDARALQWALGQLVI